MKQTKKLHPFMDHLKKAKRQNAEFCEWLAMAMGSLCADIQSSKFVLKCLI
jgi:hypothetical protein